MPSTTRSQVERVDYEKWEVTWIRMRGIIVRKGCLFFDVCLLPLSMNACFPFLPAYVVYSAFCCIIVIKIRSSYILSNSLPQYLYPMVCALIARFSKFYRCSSYSKSPSIHRDIANYINFIVLHTPPAVWTTSRSLWSTVQYIWQR